MQRQARPGSDLPQYLTLLSAGVVGQEEGHDVEVLCRLPGTQC
jgi:hypothetical protein